MRLNLSKTILVFCSFGITLLITACGSVTPAPIKDQSTPVNNSKPVVIPNWSVVNSDSKSTSVPAPAKAKPTTPQTKATTEKSSSEKPATKAADATAAVVADPGFRIGKPSSAPVGESFNGSSNKGVDYAGKMGDPVNAAADGKVIFSGNSLRSYGNLVIVKHNNSYITIYAHNSKNLVKEGDTVKRGQKIAEMGNTESESVKLHFELRKDSKPIDPLGYFDN